MGRKLSCENERLQTKRARITDGLQKRYDSKNDQELLKSQYDFQHHSKDTAAAIKAFEQKMALAVNGSIKSTSEIVVLINEKTGEKFYTRERKL